MAFAVCIYMDVCSGCDIHTFRTGRNVHYVGWGCSWERENW